MNEWYTRLLWLGAFSFASASILIWVIPERFRDLSRPGRWPVRRRQAFFSAFALAGSVFWVYYALTQYPDIERTLWNVVEIGLVNCPIAAAAIGGWLYFVGKIVRRASRRGVVARPASGDLPAPFDQPWGAAPQASAPPGPASYDPIGMIRRRAAGLWLLRAVLRLYRGMQAAERLARTPSRLGFGLGIAVVAVITVVSLVGYVRSLGPWYSDNSPTSEELYSVAMASPTDGWAVGERGTIIHYHGSSWSSVSSPTSDQLLSVAMASPTDGWAVGSAILHYSGGSWSTVSSPTSDGLDGVAMVSPTDGWAVGWSWGGDGAILHYHDGTWSSVSSPIGSPLYSVAMVSATEGWAVGGEGGDSAILHYSGGAWSRVSSPTRHTLRSVAMASPTDGWAVGERGTILRYHAGSWSSASSPTSQILHGVAMVSPTEGWAVGEGGTILQYSDGSWSRVSSANKLLDSWLDSVAMASPIAAWAVGGGGTIGHYSGGQ